MPYKDPSSPEARAARVRAVQRWRRRHPERYAASVEKQKVKTTCAACGSEFGAIPSVLRRGAGHFCSKACANRGRHNHRWKGGRRMSGGYVMILMPEHPAADSKGYVGEHRIVAERVIGKPLSRSVVVHHHNLDRADNRPANLVICQDQPYHLLLHNRMRRFAKIRAAGGDPKRDSYCADCDRALPRESFHRCRRQPDGCDSYCKACSSHRAAEKYERRVQRERRSS